MLTPTQKQQYLDKLFEWIRIPSISTLPENKGDMQKSVEFLKDYLAEIGFDRAKMQELYADGYSPEQFHPVVYAERIDDPSNKTILIYGHYDVQPVDPIDQWKSQPFSPEVRDGNIYARGATDDKGQTFTHLAALHMLSKQWGAKWPINVKFISEGEEEMGGENIEALLHQPNIMQLLKADVALVSDSGFHSEGQPAIEYGLRGLTYMQVDVKLADADLHSGVYGGGVLNPAMALVQMLSKMIDMETGKIQIPGFYDKVQDITSDEHDKLAAIPFSEDGWLKEANNSKATFGEQDYTTIERTSARPTLEINGIWGGFQGIGAKTIIPAEAHAKVSMRLVADQDPAEIAELFTNYIKQIAPAEVDVNVTTVNKGDGALVNLDSPYIKLAGEALAETFGKAPLFMRSGGSIPVVAGFKKNLGVDTILIGYGLPDDNLHSPNEKLSVEQFYKGIECNAALYQKIVKV